MQPASSEDPAWKSKSEVSPMTMSDRVARLRKESEFGENGSPIKSRPPSLKKDFMSALSLGSS